MPECRGKARDLLLSPARAPPPQRLRVFLILGNGWSRNNKQPKQHQKRGCHDQRRGSSRRYGTGLLQQHGWNEGIWEKNEGMESLAGLRHRVFAALCRDERARSPAVEGLQLRFSNHQRAGGNRRSVETDVASTGRPVSVPCDRLRNRCLGVGPPQSGPSRGGRPVDRLRSPRPGGSILPDAQARRLGARRVNVYRHHAQASGVGDRALHVPRHWFRGGGSRQEVSDLFDRDRRDARRIRAFGGPGRPANRGESADAHRGGR